MSQSDALTQPRSLSDAITTRFADKAAVLKTGHGDHSLLVAAEDWIEVAEALRDEPQFNFESLMDVCGVDHLGYGQDEWNADTATRTGFSRGVSSVAAQHSDREGPRFAVVYHLLSYTHNTRLRVKVFALNDDYPRVPSVYPIWNGADWFEREAFDMFGILFDGHPDLRRIMTDYGFIGHPFRKDFPLSGNVEVSYDAEKGRVAYQPVSIEERTLVPRVIRDDNRYSADLKDSTNDG